MVNSAIADLLGPKAGEGFVVNQIGVIVLPIGFF